MLQYVRATPLQLKGHPDFNEKWVQEIICRDPAILGLGELEVKDIERRQPVGGRLDILLREGETNKRYEVELMLGAVDESHIIRTLEYWDMERKRYPDYDHCAVIIAEKITSRFLNVLGLFNSAVPVIAIQLNAYQIENNVILTFTKVLDEIERGEDDEDDAGEPVDRQTFLQRGFEVGLSIADSCLDILRRVEPNLDLRYNKHYIGITDNRRANNFVIFWPRGQFLRIGVRLENRDTYPERLRAAGIVPFEANRRLMFEVTLDDVKKNGELLAELFRAGYEE